MMRAALTAAAVAIAAAAAAAPPHVLRYRVTHSVYGEIGSYSNVIDREGGQTVVRNEVHLQVRLFGLVLHREDGVRTEKWRDDRLVAFHGVTVANGDRVAVDGAAEGDDFVVTSLQGRMVAPGDIRPSNPWSTAILASGTMLRSDSGAIERVEVGPAKDASVKLDGRVVAVRLYRIAADPAYRLWVDADGVPVMFSVDDESGLVTFTLTERE
jgi:hypothetical protein